MHNICGESPLRNQYTLIKCKRFLLEGGAYEEVV